MSTNLDVVENALTDEPQGRVAIAEATGLEVSAVSPCLTALHNMKRAMRTSDGWVRGDGSAPKRVVHIAAESAPDAPSAKTASKRGPKRRRGRAFAAPGPVAISPPVPVPVSFEPTDCGARTMQFALTEGGDILCAPADDASAWRNFPRADALALAELVRRIPA